MSLKTSFEIHWVNLIINWYSKYNCHVSVLMNDFSKCWFFSIRMKNNFLLLEIIWLPAAVHYLIFTTMCRILISSKVGNLLQQQKRKKIIQLTKLLLNVVLSTYHYSSWLDMVYSTNVIHHHVRMSYIKHWLLFTYSKKLPTYG